jgi:hypothetical protein
MRGKIAKRLRKLAIKLYGEAKPELRERQPYLNFYRNVKALYERDEKFKRFTRQVSKGIIGAVADINKNMKKSKATIVDPTEYQRPNGDGAPALSYDLGNAEALAS